MNYSKTKMLTKEQAQQVVDYIRKYNDDVLGYGSSRAVFDFEYKGESYVVKFAGEPEGRAQNRIELNLYNSVDGPLNPIVWAYEDIFLICPRLDTLDYDFVEYVYDSQDMSRREFLEEFTGFYEYDIFDNDDKREDFRWDVVAVVDFLNDYQGNTSDNYQLGLLNGQVVAMDYGYEVGRHGELVGNIEAMLNFNDINQSILWDVLDEQLYDFEFKYVMEFLSKQNASEGGEVKVEELDREQWNFEVRHAKYSAHWTQQPTKYIKAYKVVNGETELVIEARADGEGRLEFIYEQ